MTAPGYEKFPLHDHINKLESMILAAYNEALRLDKLGLEPSQQQYDNLLDAMRSADPELYDTLVEESDSIACAWPGCENTALFSEFAGAIRLTGDWVALLVISGRPTTTFFCCAEHRDLYMKASDT